jgi:uncharacterized protein
VHIEELTKTASSNFLTERHFGRLSCAKDSQPYVTPFNYVYHENYFYSFGTVGQKIDWMREYPLVCVLVDEIVSPADWTSVIVNAKYEELTDTNRELAFALLKKQDLWWEPGYVETIFYGEPRPMEPVYFRLVIEEITGHRAVKD